MSEKFTPKPAEDVKPGETVEVIEPTPEKVRQMCIDKLQIILDHFTDQAPREEFQGWQMDGKGRYARVVKHEASPASFWHDEKLHEAMNGNDPSCEVYLSALWVQDRLKEMRA